MSSKKEILVTVGTQFPFPRLIDTVDNWLSNNPQIAERVVMQVGKNGNQSQFADSYEFLSPASYRDLMTEVNLVVSHAGIGSILSAMDYQLPIIIMPRRYKLGEHRNNHQIATARELGSRPGVNIVSTQQELDTALDNRSILDCVKPKQISSNLDSGLRSFINGADELLDQNRAL